MGAEPFHQRSAGDPEALGRCFEGETDGGHDPLLLSQSRSQRSLLWSAAAASWMVRRLVTASFPLPP
jgi:hypothetical protein